jgi:hypothetical protein
LGRQLRKEIESGSGGVRIGWVRGWYDGDLSCHPGIPPAIEHAMEVLGSAGAIIEEVEAFSIFPDVPTAAEAGLAGMEVGIWYGLSGPAGIPRRTIERLNREIARVGRRSREGRQRRAGPHEVRTHVAIAQRERFKRYRCVPSASKGVERERLRISQYRLSPRRPCLTAALQPSEVRAERAPVAALSSVGPHGLQTRRPTSTSPPWTAAGCPARIPARNAARTWFHRSPCR